MPWSAQYRHPPPFRTASSLGDTSFPHTEHRQRHARYPGYGSNGSSPAVRICASASTALTGAFWAQYRQTRPLVTDGAQNGSALVATDEASTPPRCVHPRVRLQRVEARGAYLRLGLFRDDRSPGAVGAAAPTMTDAGKRRSDFTPACRTPAPPGLQDPGIGLQRFEPRGTHLSFGLVVGDPRIARAIGTATLTSSDAVQPWGHLVPASLTPAAPRRHNSQERLQWLQSRRPHLRYGALTRDRCIRRTEPAPVAAPNAIKPRGNFVAARHASTPPRKPGTRI